MPDLAPFRRGPFDALPEKPRRPHAYDETKPCELRMDSAPFGRIAIHYRELGDGPPLLLVHGLMTTSYSWRYVFPALARRFRVIAPDMPGCGRSEKPLGPRYSADAFAVWIAEFQRAAGIRGCAAIGNSMGGYLCMRAALRDPETFSRLVNVHSPGVPDARHYALSAALAVPGLKRFLAWWIRRSPLRWAHRNVHYYDESLKSLEEAHAYGDPLATVEGARAFVKFLGETFKPADQRAFAAELARRPFPVPLLLVFSREDPLVPPSIGPRLQALVPGTPLVWLERTSHFAHVDTPEAIVEAVEPFLLAGAPAGT